MPVMRIRKILKAHHILASISGKENSDDHAMVATVVKTIKAEWIGWTPLRRRDAAIKAIGASIGGFYHPSRRHSALGDQSPIAFEAMRRKTNAEALHSN